MYLFNYSGISSLQEISKNLKLKLDLIWNSILETNKKWTSQVADTLHFEKMSSFEMKFNFHFVFYCLFRSSQNVGKKHSLKRFLTKFKMGTAGNFMEEWQNIP